MSAHPCYTLPSGPNVRALLVRLQAVEDLPPGGRAWRARCPCHGAASGVQLNVELAADDAAFVACDKLCPVAKIVNGLGIGGKGISAPPPTVVPAVRCGPSKPTKPSANGKLTDSTPVPGVVDGTDSLIITGLSTLKARPVKYLVPGRIPAGKLILWAGRGGSGKSTASRALAAAISTGRCAFGMTYPHPVRGRVLIVAAEDGPEDTILPSLLAEGADIERIDLLQGVRHESKKTPFTLLPGHVALIKARLAACPDIRLIIIDPISSFVGRARVDDHRAAELRLVLDPLNELAEESGVTILMIAHLNKTTGAAVDRIAGSAAYRDAVRAAYLVTTDPDDDTRRLLTPLKENLPAFDGTAVPFSLAELTDDQAAAILAQPQFADLDADDRTAARQQLRRVQFDAPVKADLDAATGAKKTDPNKIERCMDFVRTFLARHAYPSEELMEAAKAMRFTFDNVMEARSRLKAEGLHATNCSIFQGKWWVGFGHHDTWNRRVLASRSTDPQDSTHSQDSQDSQH